MKSWMIWTSLPLLELFTFTSYSVVTESTMNGVDHICSLILHVHSRSFYNWWNVLLHLSWHPLEPFLIVGVLFTSFLLSFNIIIKSLGCETKPRLMSNPIDTSNRIDNVSTIHVIWDLGMHNNPPIHIGNGWNGLFFASMEKLQWLSMWTSTLQRWTTSPSLK
jgi:hypothetical protein